MYWKTNLNKDFQPRMPFHDIAVQIRGDVVVDLLRHFVQYWYFVKTQSLNLINENERISCKAYKECVDGVKRHLLVDVRPKVEFKMCSLPNSLSNYY